MKLTANEKQVLSVIEQHPGVVPTELGTLLTGIAPASASALTSRLIRLRKVNRVKVPMTATFRYFPLGHALPPGVDAWDNKLVRVRRTSRASNGAHHDPITPDADVLLTFPTGANESTTLTVGQARRLYDQLAVLFGGVR